MKHRISRQTKEILALVAFSFFAGSICLHISYEMFSRLNSRHWYTIPIKTYAPLIAMIALGIMIGAAITRFVILIRHRVAYGHCPHCGGKLEPESPTCIECNGVIRKSRNEHEKRTKHIGVVRRAIIALAWCFLITWWFSTVWEANLETSCFVAGDGHSIRLTAGGVILNRRFVEISPGVRTPTQLIPEMMEAAEIKGQYFSVTRNETPGYNTWWFQRDTDDSYPYTIFAALRNSPVRERILALCKKYGVRNTFLIYSQESVEIPLWLPTAIFGSVALILRIRDRAFPPGCCQTCGYDLDSVAGPACPECGTPKIESTYGIPTTWRRREPDAPPAPEGPDQKT